MEDKKDLKSYRSREIPMLILGNILVLLFFSGIFEFSGNVGNDSEWISLALNILNSSILSSILYIFTLILDGVFNDKLKSKLVYIFFGKSPGERVFTQIMSNNKDNRFSYNQLKEKRPDIFSNMPSDKKEKFKYENNEWYKLLNKYRNEDMVFQSHRDWLMYRDMYCSTICVLIIYLILSLAFRVIPFHVNFVAFIIVLLLLLNIAARNKARRFVYNVVTREATQQ